LDTPHYLHIPRRDLHLSRLTYSFSPYIPPPSPTFLLFFFNDTATTEIYTLSLHDALPIFRVPALIIANWQLLSLTVLVFAPHLRSEEHTSELQSPYDLVCRLLLEKKKKKINAIHTVIDLGQVEETSRVLAAARRRADV